MAVAKIDGVADGAGSRVAAVAARHERTLLRVARKASLCDDDALDAYQRALEIFVRRVDTVDPETEVAWLKVVVRHEAMAIRRARSESVAIDALDLDAFVPGVERSIEDRIASEERVRRSAEALRSLKPDEASALMLKAHGLSYEEIGARQGWSYTKVNRAVTEGRRRFLAVYEDIASGAECERFAPIVEALGTGAATSSQVLQIRPHLRHCTSCRAAVRDLHVSRLRRASLFWPIFAVAEPLASLKHDAAALFHRAQASDLATGAGMAGSGGGGRIATIGAVIGVCLGGASVGTVCVMTGAVPDLGPRDIARAHAKKDPPQQRKEPQAVRTRAPAPTATAVPSPSPQPTPARSHRAPTTSSSSERPRRRETKAAAPREFGFENRAPTHAAPATAAAATQPPPPAPEPAPASAAETTPKSSKFSPAEQEFAP